MSDQRIPLSDFAFNTLINAQVHLNDIQNQVRAAQAELSRVVMLVLDGHGLPLDTNISLDPQTKELIYSSKEIPELVIPE